MVILKELISKVSTLGGCGSFERTSFELLSKGVVVLKENDFEQLLL